jgi:hypothetical protein
MEKVKRIIEYECIYCNNFFREKYYQHNYFQANFDGDSFYPYNNMIMRPTKGSLYNISFMYLIYAWKYNGDYNLPYALYFAEVM